MDRFELLRTELTRRCPGLELREEEPMARHTSFHIGGPARLMALPRTEEEARETLQAAWALEIPPFFLGNGSNLLVADRGYEGFVVKPAGALEEIRALPGTAGGEGGGWRREGPRCCPGSPRPRWIRASPAWSSPRASRGAWAAG